MGWREDGGIGGRVEEGEEEAEEEEDKGQKKRRVDEEAWTCLALFVMVSLVLSAW